MRRFDTTGMASRAVHAIGSALLLAGRLAKDRRGASAAEYALILGLVFVSVVVGFGLLGQNLLAALEGFNTAYP